MAAAKRARLAMRPSRPKLLADVGQLPPLVVTVCDQAHEELDPPPSWLHWSITDPVAEGSPDAFDVTVTELRDRISRLLSAKGARR